MRKISLVVLLCHWLTAVTAQQQYSKAVNEQIARVEANLSGGIVIDGKPYTLAERMKHIHVYTLFLMSVFHSSCGQKQTNVHYSGSQLKENSAGNLAVSLADTSRV